MSERMTLIDSEQPLPSEILRVLAEHFDAQPADVARWLVDLNPADALRDYCYDIGIALQPEGKQ